MVKMFNYMIIFHFLSTYSSLQFISKYQFFRGSQSGGSQDSDCVTEYSTTSTVGFHRGGIKPEMLQKFDDRFRYKSLQLRYKDKSEYVFVINWDHILSNQNINVPDFNI